MRILRQSTWLGIYLPQKTIGFTERKILDDGGYKYVNRSDKITVICYACVEHNGKRRWILARISKPSRLPPWENILRVKHAFLGDRQVLQQYPTEEICRTVKLNTVDLWACIDESPFPDLSKITEDKDLKK